MTKRRAKEDVLGELHEEIAKQLLLKIKSGEASPAEINAAIKFLQNNHIEADVLPGDPLDQLRQSLPQFDDEDDEEATAH